MYFLSRKSGLRLWWRREVMRLRRIPPAWLFITFIILTYIIFNVPNPFSSQYNRIPMEQYAAWDKVHELFDLKEQVLFNETLTSNIKVVKHGSHEPHFTSTILIVLYTKVFGDTKFCSFPPDRIFGKSCPSKHRCQWSCDRSKYREADALIFHAYDILGYQKPILSRSETKSGAVWILWSDEPPSIIQYAQLESYRFNWTISYKFHSEVSIAAYGVFSKRDSPLSNEKYQFWLEQQFHTRSKGALWFVSNCLAKTRLRLFHRLKDASKIVVEGYGRCVDYYPYHLCGSFSQCEHDYLSNFKFYLSFESNTCRDYITEKFYKAFYHSLIPIVYGPSKKDYATLAPANSFIHVDDFDKNMDHLASYLEEISSNITLFSMYHQWRKNYNVIIDGKALERIRMCELCQRLVNLRRGDITYYNNIEQFYNDRCTYL